MVAKSGEKWQKTLKLVDCAKLRKYLFQDYAFKWCVVPCTFAILGDTPIWVDLNPSHSNSHPLRCQIYFLSVANFKDKTSKFFRFFLN